MGSERFDEVERIRHRLTYSEVGLTSHKQDCKNLLKILDEINTPEIREFTIAIEREAKHQRIRWESGHDAGKTDADWFWLIGYLAGKALNPKTQEKQLHHIITTAAACLNWHSAKIGVHTKMRPGIEPPN